LHGRTVDASSSDVVGKLQADRHRIRGPFGVAARGPLCVFAHRAWLERERAEDGFSIWSSLAARHMSAQLSASRRDYPPSQLMSSERSSMTDASALFDRVLATRPVPIDTRQLALILVAAIVPMLLPLLTLLPLAEIWRRLVAILLRRQGRA
jgi:hypothetical protein